jgi:Tfp pilus assembly protein PilF/DnaJ-domain-containing protein 1
MPDEILFSGRLKQIRLPKLLRMLGRARKTGVLRVWRNDQDRSLYLKEGDVIFATSRYPDDRLGEVLLKAGKITLAQFESAVEGFRETGKRLGTVLVEQGSITPKDLFWAVSFQVKEIILSLFTWVDGEYEFQEGDLPTEELISLKMSTGNLVLEGLRRINDWYRLTNEIPPLDTVLRLTTDPLTLFQAIQLDATEKQVLNLVDGARTIRQVFQESPLTAIKTLQLIHFYCSVGIVEPISGAAEEAAEKREEAVAAEAATRADPEITTPSEEISVGQIARELDQARQENLTVFREELLKPAEPLETPKAETRRQRIHAAYEALSGQNHYEILGLNIQSSRDEIKRAYFRLAKEYHPDRHFEKGLEDLKEVLGELFSRITEAYDTLLMEDRRKRYDAGLLQQKYGKKTSEAAPAKETQARNQFLQGKESLRRGDFKAAAYYLEAALQQDPKRAEAHTLLADALSRIPGRRRDAESHYQSAMELEPSNVMNYIGLGLLYKGAGMNQRAVRQFEEALTWDPENAQARNELKGLT